MDNNKCKICTSDVSKCFSKTVLRKHAVNYYKCSSCGFIQTEKPHWLSEAYSSAITSLDVGLVNRNIKYGEIVEDMLYRYFNAKGRFLDFAGGYGLFTRIMRDKGFNYYHQDKFCDNLFARYFTFDDLRDQDKKFELVTAFEFMEHAEDPIAELQNIFKLTDNFLFSTELVPDKDVESWWYIGFEHGQHIAFYTRDSIRKLAEKFDKEYYTNGYMHLLTTKRGLDVFQSKENRGIIDRIFRCQNINQHMLVSKTRDDYDYINKKQV